MTDEPGSDAEDAADTPPDSESPPKGPDLSRRKFLMYAAIGGAAVTASALGAGYLVGYFKPRTSDVPPWEIAPGVVDYTKVPIPPGGTTVTLRIAQWYDYWPPSFLDISSWSFNTYMKQNYNISIQYQIDYFTSMEDLSLWVSPLQKREYDVFFPSNEVGPIFDSQGLLYNLNPDWLPNTVHLDPSLLDKPAGNPWNRRSDGTLRSIPYFWGTTGIGFRTDVLNRTDIEALGWDLFTQSSVAGVALDGKMNMLDEMRDVLLVGFKMAGWADQISKGGTANGNVPPNGVQWTSNETDPSRITLGKNWLLTAKPHLFSYNSTSVLPSLQNKVAYANHAWNGDAVLANAPDTTTPAPVDYVVPQQGSRWWVDAMSIHSKCRNLWVAHQFMNFIHDPTVMRNLAVWNKYACTNLDARALIPITNGWDLANDPRLYPDATEFQRLDLAVDVGIDVVKNLYTPAWNELKFGASA